MKKIILLSALVALIIAGCSSAPEIIQDTKQLTYLSNGIWLGVLPCEDCDEIDFQLNLKNDFTFVQKFVYKGKSDELIIDEGNWSFVSDSIIHVDGSEASNLFLIEGKYLILLDEDENINQSSSGKKYLLHKDPTTVKDIQVVEEIKDVEPDEEHVQLNAQHYQDKFLAGVDFIARGNEPNWTLEIDLEKSMKFETTDNIKITTPAVQGIKAQDSDVTLYRAKSENGELVVTVIRDNCEDNMSGEKHPYKVRVEYKGSKDANYTTYDGCGNYLYDNRLYDIYVMEEMTGINFKKEKLMKGMPQFEFNLAEMRFSGHAGCNTIGGSINVVGNQITFGALMGTLMACPNMKVEKVVIDALNQKTVAYSIDKMKLTIVSGKTKMVLKKVD